MNNDHWSDSDFDRWCAETAMGWEFHNWHPLGDSTVVRGYFTDYGTRERVLQRTIAHWHPSTDLNAMREVEMRVVEENLGPNYWKAILDNELSEGGTVNDINTLLFTASVEQRKAAIIAIKPQIEEALKASTK